MSGERERKRERREREAERERQRERQREREREKEKERERRQSIYAPTCVHTCKLLIPIRLNGESDHFPYQTKGIRAPISLADI